MIHNFACLATRNNTILRHVLHEGFERGWTRRGRLKNNGKKDRHSRKNMWNGRSADRKPIMLLQSYIDNNKTHTHTHTLSESPNTTPNTEKRSMFLTRPSSGIYRYCSTRLNIVRQYSDRKDQSKQKFREIYGMRCLCPNCEPELSMLHPSPKQASRDGRKSQRDREDWKRRTSGNRETIIREEYR